MNTSIITNSTCTSKADFTSDNIFNKIRQIVYSWYTPKEFTKNYITI